MTDPHHLTRRDAIRGGLTAAALLGTAAGPARAAAPRRPDPRAAAALAALEARHGARLGAFGVNHRTGALAAHRADERFAFCSTYKGPLAARVLHLADGRAAPLNAIVHYDRHALVAGDFVTQLYLETGMTVRGLCAAATGQSDNAAANLLYARTGGPPALTRWLRALGDTTTRCDRDEPAVNTAIPGDPRDTTTPRAWAALFTRLLLGSGLPGPDRTQLRYWLQGDTTNLARFRAGLPTSWTLADKTGTGDYGVANDAGVVWTGRGTPLTLVVLTSRATADADPDEALVAGAARILAAHLAPGE